MFKLNIKQLYCESSSKH